MWTYLKDRNDGLTGGASGKLSVTDRDSSISAMFNRQVRRKDIPGMNPGYSVWFKVKAIEWPILASLCVAYDSYCNLCSSSLSFLPSLRAVHCVELHARHFSATVKKKKKNSPSAYRSFFFFFFFEAFPFSHISPVNSL